MEKHTGLHCHYNLFVLNVLVLVAINRVFSFTLCAGYIYEFCFLISTPFNELQDNNVYFVNKYSKLKGYK